MRSLEETLRTSFAAFQRMTFAHARASGDVAHGRGRSRGSSGSSVRLSSFINNFRTKLYAEGISESEEMQESHRILI